jgi:F/Y-rich N-terminus
MSIGKIRADRPGFHTESHIFPAGYKSVRLYWSGTRVTQRTPYVCEVRQTLLFFDAPYMYCSS